MSYCQVPVPARHLSPGTYATLLNHQRGLELSGLAIGHGEGTVLFGRVVARRVNFGDLVIERQLHRAGQQGHLDQLAGISRAIWYMVPAKLTEPWPSVVRVTLGPPAGGPWSPGGYWPLGAAG